MHKIYILAVLLAIFLCLGCVSKNTNFENTIDYQTTTQNETDTSIIIINNENEENANIITDNDEEEQKEIEEKIELCKKITYSMQRDICLKDFGETYSSLSACEAILDDQTNAECLSYVQITKGIIACEKIRNETLAAGCYKNYANHNDDPSACSRISDLHYKELCYSGFIYQMADIKNISYCDLFRDYTSHRGTCFTYMAYSFKDETICDNILEPIPGEGSVSVKDTCLSYLSSSSTDLALCNKINNNNTKWNCFSTIAQNTENLSICETFLPEDKMTVCLYNIAMNNNDSTVCERITDTYYRDYCYLKIAMR